MGAQESTPMGSDVALISSGGVRPERPLDHEERREGEVRGMPQGTVITFSRELGYGFVRMPGEAEALLRFDSAELPDYQCLSFGDRVWFKEAEALSGTVAIRVRRIPSGPSMLCGH